MVGFASNGATAMVSKQKSCGIIKKSSERKKISE